MRETVATYATSREAILAARKLNGEARGNEVYATRRLADGRCEVTLLTPPTP